MSTWESILMHYETNALKNSDTIVSRRIANFFCLLTIFACEQSHKLLYFSGRVSQKSRQCLITAIWSNVCLHVSSNQLLTALFLETTFKLVSDSARFPGKRDLPWKYGVLFEFPRCRYFSFCENHGEILSGRTSTDKYTESKREWGNIFEVQILS